MDAEALLPLLGPSLWRARALRSTSSVNQVVQLCGALALTLLVKGCNKVMLASGTLCPSASAHKARNWNEKD